MTDLNSVFLTGNVVHNIGEKDIVKIGETTKLTITIANNQSIKTNGEWKTVGNFFEVVMWGKLADNLKPYIVKGKGLAVVGTLKQDRWEKDGKKGSKIYIVADSVKLLGGKADNDSHAQGNNDLGFPEDIPYDNKAPEPEF